MISRKFRLLMAGIDWPPETFLKRLIVGLADAGVEITAGCAERPDLQHPNFHWLPTPAWDGLVPVRLLRLGSMATRAAVCGSRDACQLARLLRSAPKYCGGLAGWNRMLPFAGRRWDAIYFPWNAAAIDHLPVFGLGMPVVVSCRGAQVNVAPHNPDRAHIRDGLRATFARAAAVHCVSDEIKQEAMNHGLNPAKAWVIRPAVDPDKFHPASEPRLRNGEFRFATTGSLIWRKGHEYALMATRLLVDRGFAVQFDIIGGGPDQQRLLYTVHDLGLEKCVTLHGSMKEEAVMRLLQQCNAFVLSSLSEGISNAVLEAMACGLPVVTTDCGGMAEAVADGVEGFVVPVRDPGALADALAKLASGADLARTMGRAARERVVSQFTLKRQVQQWLKLYETVLNGVGPLSTRSSPHKPSEKDEPADRRFAVVRCTESSGSSLQWQT